MDWNGVTHTHTHRSSQHSPSLQAILKTILHRWEASVLLPSVCALGGFCPGEAHSAAPPQCKLLHGKLLGGPIASGSVSPVHLSELDPHRSSNENLKAMEKVGLTRACVRNRSNAATKHL